MKILFSPSEKKHLYSSYEGSLKDNISYANLYSKRKYVIDKYNDILTNGTNEEISKLFGIKIDNIKESMKKPLNETAPLEEAILRYDGVAYDYLAFNDLNTNSKEYVRNNVIIFSNLLGPIFAKDKIPFYKLKQSEKLKSFAPEKFYKENFSNILDKTLDNEFIIDLRASFYEKFYTVTKPYVTCKFLKNGKTISHWAKAYRGILLKELAIKDIQNEEDFTNLQIPNLQIKEIKEIKLKKEYIFEIN